MKSNSNTEQTSLLHNEQPPSHSSLQNVNELSPIQVIPKSLFDCCEYKYDLTVLEYSKYNELKTQCLIEYDKDNETHITELNKLFDKSHSIYNSILLNDNESNFSYKTIGFQTTTNPHSDFRNGGFISLLFMIHYITLNETEFKEVLQFKYFSFAITCINIVNDVKTFLRLITDEELRHVKEYQVNNAVLSNRKQIKHFAKALSENDILFYEIATIVFKQVITAFKINYVEDKLEQNYLMIPKFIKQSVNNISDALLTCTTSDELISCLQKK